MTPATPQLPLPDALEPIPDPPTLSFAAEYRAAIARGYDPFEQNDAHWEA